MQRPLSKGREIVSALGNFGMEASNNGSDTSREQSGQVSYRTAHHTCMKKSSN